MGQLDTHCDVDLLNNLVLRCSNSFVSSTGQTQRSVAISHYSLAVFESVFVFSPLSQVFLWAVCSLAEIWHVKYSNIHCVADLLAGLRTYQVSIAPANYDPPSQNYDQPSQNYVQASQNYDQPSQNYDQPSQSCDPPSPNLIHIVKI